MELGDEYADSVVFKSSMWYFHGENAMGAPDNKSAVIYFDYGNGFLTLDMGEGEEIIDPDTNNIIEREEILKAHLNVIHVQEKISILESDEIETIVKNVPGILDNSVLSRMYSSTIERDVMKPLNVGASSDDEIDLIIKVGNSVKSIKPDNPN